MRLFVVVFTLLLNVYGKDMQLPSWLDETLRESRGKDTDKQYLDSGCTLKVVNTQCISTITPNGDNCYRLLNLKKMLKGYWKLRDFYKLTDRNLPAEKFYAILLTVDNCQDRVTFLANNTATINFLDRYLLLTNVSLAVTFQNYHTKVINNSQISINVQSNVELNERMLTLQASKAFNDSKYAISINGERVTFLDILQTFRVEHTFYEKICSSIERDVIENMEFKKFYMKGLYNLTQGFYLTSTATLRSSGSNVTTFIEIILIRKHNQPIKLAFILKGKLEEDVLTFLSALLQRRRNAIPVIDRSVDVGVLSISGHHITQNEYQSDTRLGDIPVGIALQTLTSFNDVNKRALTTNVTTDSKSYILSRLKICEKKDKINFDAGNKIILSEFLKKIHDLQNPDFPDWLYADDDVYAQLKKVTFTGTNKNQVSVQVTMLTTIDALFNTMKIEKPKLELLTDRDKEGGVWNCGTLKSKQKLGTRKADVVLTCDEGLKNFRITISLPTFGFQDFLSLIKVDVLPEQLKVVMEKLLKFDIQDFRVEASQSADQFIRITGSPLLFGLQNLTMEGISWLENDKKKIAVGIVLKDAKLDDLLERMIGKKLSISWIGDTKAAILISNTNLESKTKRQSLPPSSGNATFNSTMLTIGVQNNSVSISHGHSRKRREVYQSTGYNNIAIGQAQPEVQQQTLPHYNSPELVTRPNSYDNSNSVGYSTTEQQASSVMEQKPESEETSAITSNLSSEKPTSLMDQLIQAYNTNNQEKNAKNYELQRELNEGVLDESADKRSILGHNRARDLEADKQRKGKLKKSKSNPGKLSNKGKKTVKRKKKRNEKQRKRSEIRKFKKRRKHHKKHKTSKRNFINKHTNVDKNFKEKYLTWLRTARKGSPRENIENIFDDAYKLTSFQNVANLNNVQSALTEGENTYKKDTKTPDNIKKNSNVDLDVFKQSQLDNAYEAELAQYQRNVNPVSLLKPLSRREKQTKPEFEKEEYGVEREAVAYIPETGADVYNLYKKEHRNDSELNNGSNDDDEEDEEEARVATESYTRKKNETADSQEEEKQNENNDLIQEYARLNAELAAMHEPTVAPLVAPQVNQQEEIQKKLYHHAEKEATNNHDYQQHKAHETSIQLDPSDSKDLTVTLNKLKSIQTELKKMDSNNSNQNSFENVVGQVKAKEMPFMLEQAPLKTDVGSALAPEKQTENAPGSTYTASEHLSKSVPSQTATPETIVAIDNKSTSPNEVLPLQAKIYAPTTTVSPEHSENPGMAQSHKELNHINNIGLSNKVTETKTRTDLGKVKVSEKEHGINYNNAPIKNKEHQPSSIQKNAKLATPAKEVSANGLAVAAPFNVTVDGNDGREVKDTFLQHETKKVTSTTVNSKTESMNSWADATVDGQTPDNNLGKSNMVYSEQKLTQGVRTHQEKLPQTGDANTEVTQVKFVAPKMKTLRVRVKGKNDDIIPAKSEPNHQSYLKHKPLPANTTNSLIASYKFVPMKTNQFHVNYGLSNKIGEIQNLTMKNNILQSIKKPIAPQEDSLQNIPKAKAPQEDTLQHIQKAKASQENTLQNIQKTKALKEDTLQNIPKAKATQENTLQNIKKLKGTQDDTLQNIPKAKATQENTLQKSKKLKATQEDTLQSMVYKPNDIKEKKLSTTRILSDSPPYKNLHSASDQTKNIQNSMIHQTRLLEPITEVFPQKTTATDPATSIPDKTQTKKVINTNSGDTFFSKIRKLALKKDARKDSDLSDNDAEDIVIVTKTAERKIKPKRNHTRPKQNIFHVELTGDEGIGINETTYKLSEENPMNDNKLFGQMKERMEVGIKNQKSNGGNDSHSLSFSIVNNTNDTALNIQNSDFKTGTNISEASAHIPMNKIKDDSNMYDSKFDHVSNNTNNSTAADLTSVKNNTTTTQDVEATPGSTTATKIKTNSEMSSLTDTKLNTTVTNATKEDSTHLAANKPVADATGSKANTEQATPKLSSARNNTDSYQALNNSATDGDEENASMDQDAEKDHEEIMEAKSELTAFKSQQSKGSKERNFLEETYGEPNRLSSPFNKNDTHVGGRDYNITEEEDDDDRLHGDGSVGQKDDEDQEELVALAKTEPNRHTTHEKSEEEEILSLAKNALKSNTDHGSILPLHHGDNTVSVLHDGNDTLASDDSDVKDKGEKGKIYEVEDALSNNDIEVKTYNNDGLKRQKHKHVYAKERNELTLQDEDNGAEETEAEEGSDNNEYSIDENNESALIGKTKSQDISKVSDNNTEEEEDEAEELTNQDEDMDTPALKSVEDVKVEESTETMKEDELKDKLEPDEEEEIVVKVPRKSQHKVIELQENDDNSKILTDYVNKNVKLSDKNPDQIAGKLSDYASNINLLGRKVEAHPSRKLEKVADILSDYRKKLKHGINARKRDERKNKTMYLVKNKNLQVVMEIRPDSKTNAISVETEGLQNLYKNKHKLLPKFHPNQRNYSYLDKDDNTFEDSIAMAKQIEHGRTRHGHRIHRKKHLKSRLDEGLESMEKELIKKYKMHSKEHNKRKFQPHPESESIDDSISKKDSKNLDDSLVNHKYESILRPEQNAKDQYITVGNGSYIENGFDDELRNEVSQIGKVETSESEVFLNALPRAHIYNNSEPKNHVSKKNETFSREEEIIETYSKRERPIEGVMRKGNIKRMAIPETSMDAYNLYNGTTDYGEDMLDADEFKPSKTTNTEMETFHFKNKTQKHSKGKSHGISVETAVKKMKDKKKNKKLQIKNDTKKHKKEKTKNNKRRKNEKGLHLDSMESNAKSYETSLEQALKEYLYPQNDKNMVNSERSSNKDKTGKSKREKTKKGIITKEKKPTTKIKKRTTKEKKKNKKVGNSSQRRVILQTELKPQAKRNHKKRSSKVNKNARSRLRHRNRNSSLDDSDIREIPSVDGQQQGNLTQKQSDDVINNISQTLTKNPGNISQALSDDSPGKQEHNNSIMESFNVWIQNTTGVNFKRRHNNVVGGGAEILVDSTEMSPAFGKLRNSTEDSVIKEVIGTTLKGKSKNLQYSLMQSKRNEGKLHMSDAQREQRNESSTFNNSTMLYGKFIKQLNSANIKVNETKTVNETALYYNNTKFNQSNNSKAVARAKHTNMKIERKEFATSELRSLEVVEGVSVDVEFLPPGDCEGNKMCLFIKEKLHDVDALKLQGSFNAKGVQLSFKYPGQTDLTESTSLRNILLGMSIEGVKSKVVIEAELRIMDPALKFIGEISIDATGSLQFEMSMSGIWKKAFGINNLAIGNALLSLSYQPGAPMPGFELGGDVWFGVLGTGNEIKSKVVFGFDPTDPTGNYLYGKTDKLSIGVLFKALNKSVPLPNPIKDSGFPKGLQIAFTSNPKGVDIPKDNIHVEFGFFISGLINLLGYEASCKIKITSNEIDIDVKMSPMEFANGLIKFHRSITDNKKGPAFTIKVGKTGLLVKAEGAACLLGIQAEAFLLITNTEFKMNLKANLFDLMEGNIMLLADASQGVAAAKFRLEACLSIKIEKLMQVITDRLNAIADLAKNAIKRAKEKVKQTAEVFDRAKAKLAEQEARIKEREAQVNSETRQILKNRRDVSTNCFVSCPKVCQGGYTDDSHCTKVFDGWLSCRSYSPCFKRAPDLDCVLKCENEKFKKRGFNLLAKASAKMKLLALAGAKVSLKFAKRFADLAKLPMKIAEGLMKVIEKLVSIGTDLANSMAKAALQDVFQFHHFCISANLGDTDSLCVGFNMSISLLKKELAVGGDLCLNGKMFETIGNDAVNKQYPESTKMERGLKEKEKEFSKLDKETEKAEKEEQKSKDKVVHAKAKRVYIPSRLEEYYEKLLYEPEPIYSFHSDIISAIYGRHGSPNNTAVDDSDLNVENIRAMSSDNTSCGNLTHTISSYNDIAKALDEILQHAKSEKEYLGKVRRAIEDSLIRNELASLNMSAYDKQQYEWYASSLRRSFDRWFNKASAKLEKRQNGLIPKCVGQVHQLLRKGGYPELQLYMRSLYQQAQYAAAGKRSTISTTVTEEENLDDIRKSFEELLFKNVDTSLEEKISHVTKIKRKLALAQTFNKICAVSANHYDGKR